MYDDTVLRSTAGSSPAVSDAKVAKLASVAMLRATDSSSLRTPAGLRATPSTRDTSVRLISSRYPLSTRSAADGSAPPLTRAGHPPRQATAMISPR